MPIVKRFKWIVFSMTLAIALIWGSSLRMSAQEVVGSVPASFEVAQLVSVHDNLLVQVGSGEFVLPPLPYSYDALEPYIDEQTMTLHHDKHHAGYVKNLNNAIALSLIHI